MNLDLKGALFYTPEQIATMFEKPLRWVYRHSSGKGFLAPAARHFNSKTLLFLRTAVEAIIIDGAAEGVPKKGFTSDAGELYNSTHRRADP